MIYCFNAALFIVLPSVPNHSFITIYVAHYVRYATQRVQPLSEYPVLCASDH